jgi:hypothetical protein
MRRIRTRWLGLAVLAGGLGCGGEHLNGPVDYASSGGLDGAGYGTGLHIDVDGHATRTLKGQAFPFDVDDSTLRGLRHRLAAADLPERQNDFMSVHTPDAFVDCVTAELVGTTYTVCADQDEPAPIELRDLIFQLRVLSKTPLQF